MAITNLRQLEDEARRVGPRVVVVAAGQEPELLEAAHDATAGGIARFVLVGDESTIRSLGAERGIDLTEMTIIDVPSTSLSAREAIRRVREGSADLAMKGKIDTAEFLRAALDRDAGLRTGRLLTHVAIYEIPGIDRLLFVSDAGMVALPTLEDKVAIVQNAVDVAHRIGIPEPRVAVLAATEMVNPKLPTSLDAAALSKMAERGQIRGAIVDGPLALDNAVSIESARAKGIRSPVAGLADILIAPNVEAGNMLVKAITYFAGGKMAGVVAGGQRPLIVASRSDPHETKLASIGLGVLLS